MLERDGVVEGFPFFFTFFPRNKLTFNQFEKKSQRCDEKKRTKDHWKVYGLLIYVFDGINFLDLNFHYVVKTVENKYPVDSEILKSLRDGEWS